jgi:hypothetical protein
MSTDPINLSDTAAEMSDAPLLADNPLLSNEPAATISDSPSLVTQLANGTLGGVLPWLGTMPAIDGAIQAGRGVVGAVVGQPFAVRRLDDNTNASIMNNAPIISGFPAKVKRTTRKVDFENEPFSLLVFESKCDNRLLQLGDHFTQYGYRSDGAKFILAEMRPTQPTLWMRAANNIAITRPVPQGGQSVQQPPLGGAIRSPGYFGVWKGIEQVLTLSGGLYAFVPADEVVTPAVVPADVQQLNRIRDANKPEIAVQHYRDHYLCYVPLLPGENLQELDIVNFGNGDRYEIASIYTSGDVGLAGYICVLEKLA